MSEIYSEVLSACYLALCALSFIQLGRTIVHRHKIQSFRFGFLLVCFLWTWLRVIWFMFESSDWPRWLSSLIYFLPNACQIATFSLLILFYAKLVHRHRWRFLRLRFLGFCILSNTAMVLLTLTFSLLMDRVQHTEDSDPTSTDAQDVKEFVYKLYFISSAVFFGVLVVLAAIYLRKLRTARGGSTAGTSKREVVMTSLIFLIFLSRCIWDFCAAFDSDSNVFRHQISESVTSHWKLMGVATFLSLFIWEVVPTLMVIVYFRNIPSTSDSHCVGAWSFLHASCARRCLAGWPCRFPPEYFEKAEYGVDAPEADEFGDVITEQLHGGIAGGVTRGGPADPPYTRMEDDSGGGMSNALPPMSFVRTNSSAAAYGRAGITHPNMLPIAVVQQQQQQQAGSLSASGMHLGIHAQTDLYGSPTWLNPNHPALTQLTPPGKANFYPPQQSSQSQSQSHQPPQPYGNLALTSHQQSQLQYHASHYDDEDDFQSHQFVHPYLQQQQQQIQQQFQQGSRYNQARQ